MHPPTMAAGFQAIILAASMPNRPLLFVSANLVHQGGMMHGGDGGTEGVGMGEGGEFFCLM